MGMTERQRQAEIAKLQAKIEELRNMEVEPEVDIQRWKWTNPWMEMNDKGSYCTYKDVVRLVKKLKPTLHAGGKAWWTGKAREGDVEVYQCDKAQVVTLALLDPSLPSIYNYKLLLHDGRFRYTQAEFLTPLPDDVEE